MKGSRLSLKAILGPKRGDDKSVRILNRVVSWISEGIRYEPDQRHADIIIGRLGMKGKKALSTPGVKPANMKDEEDDDEPIEAAYATEYRRLVARANYLTQDRSDIRYATKELSRHMSKPRKRDWRALVRLGKYFIGRGRYIARFDYQRKVDKIHVWTPWADTDYAGCRDTRKSTSGGLNMIGNHMIRSWSSTQRVIALKANTMAWLEEELKV